MLKVKALRYKKILRDLSRVKLLEFRFIDFETTVTFLLARGNNTKRTKVFIEQIIFKFESESSEHIKTLTFKSVT